MAKKVTPLTHEAFMSFLNEAGQAARTDAADNITCANTDDWHKSFVGRTFGFFGYNNLGLVIHVLFTFDGIKKMELGKCKSILTGTIVVYDKQISGDSITIDFKKNRIIYRTKEDGYSCTTDLEVDNRYKKIWDKFYEQLKNQLETKQEKDVK